MADADADEDEDGGQCDGNIGWCGQGGTSGQESTKGRRMKKLHCVCHIKPWVLALLKLQNLRSREKPKAPEAARAFFFVVT